MTKRYLNKRAKLYDRLRDKFVEGMIEIPTDEELQEELMAMKKKESENGFMQIISKKELRKIISRSPDKADAVMLSYNVDDFIPLKEKHGEYGNRNRFKRRVFDSKPTSWMGAG